MCGATSLYRPVEDCTSLLTLSLVTASPGEKTEKRLERELNLRVIRRLITSDAASLKCFEVKFIWTVQGCRIFLLNSDILQEHGDGAEGAEH